MNSEKFGVSSPRIIKTMLCIDFLSLLCYNKIKAVILLKKYISIPILLVLCIILYVVFAKPAIERRTWVLSMAQKAEPFSVVAHKSGYDFSDDDSGFFEFSKEIELTCTAKDGKIIITDKTNNKTYEGTYKVTSWGKFIKQSYAVVIDGKEGTANISSSFNRSLFISVGGYYLHFEIQ